MEEKVKKIVELIEDKKGQEIKVTIYKGNRRFLTIRYYVQGVQVETLMQ